jgi:hypothetical protein
MASVTPLERPPVPAFKTGDLAWQVIKGGPEFKLPIDYSLALLRHYPEQGRIDFLVRWAPNSYCHFHRHLGDTTTMVLEGEHHIVDTGPTETVHKTRTVGHYAHSPAGDLHQEYGGPQGSLLFFSMHSPDGRLFEIMGPDDQVAIVATIDDIVSGRLV